MKKDTYHRPPQSGVIDKDLVKKDAEKQGSIENTGLLVAAALAAYYLYDNADMAMPNSPLEFSIRSAAHTLTAASYAFGGLILGNGLASGALNAFKGPVGAIKDALMAMADTWNWKPNLDLLRDAESIMMKEEKGKDADAYFVVSTKADGSVVHRQIADEKQFAALKKMAEKKELRLHLWEQRGERIHESVTFKGEYCSLKVGGPCTQVRNLDGNILIDSDEWYVEGKLAPKEVAESKLREMHGISEFGDAPDLDLDTGALGTP